MVDFNLMQGLAGGSVRDAFEKGEKRAENDRMMNVMKQLNQQMGQNPDFNLGARTEFGELLATRPDLAKGLAQRFGMLEQTDQDRYVNDFTAIRDQVAMGNLEEGKTLLMERIADLTERGRDPVDSVRALKILDSNPDQFVTGVNNMMYARTQKDPRLAGASSDGPAAVKNYEYFTAVLDDPRSTDEQKKAARIALKLEAPPSNSMWMRLLEDPEAMENFINKNRELTEAKAQGKYNVEKIMLPQIRSAVKTAEVEAQAAGQAFTDLQRFEASKPTFDLAYNNLKDLAQVATFSLAGTAFDTLALELFGYETKGGTAAAEMDGIINNTILPLLKPTFGGAISDEELKQLRKTLIAEDGGPMAKLAVLDAWMEALEMKLNGDRSAVDRLMSKNEQNMNPETMDVELEDDEALINKYLD